MRMWALQNRDFKELFWSEQNGWCDENDADYFFGRELCESHGLEIQIKTKGKWVMVDWKQGYTSEDF